MAWTPYPDPSCVRRAWLTLGSQSIDLENPAGGWFCEELDLGFPAVRDVVSNRPDQDGVDDRTQFYGARAVSASIKVVAGAGAQIDDVADNFAPFMQPASRPVLHVILDRPGTAERTMTVRAAGYGWKIAGDSERDVQLQFVAADPYLYDPAVNTVVAYAGSSTANGRVYNLTFNRTYPAGGGVATSGRIQPAGTMPVQPLVRIYGPITAPRVYFATHPGGGQVNQYIQFASGFVLGVNQWVDVDTKAHTAYLQSDTTQPAFVSINFAATIWPVLPVSPGWTDMTLSGSGAMSGVTQVQAIWQDGYLS